MRVPNSLFRDGGNRFGSILYSTQPENGEYIIGVPHVRSITSHFDGKSQSNEPENVSLNRKTHPWTAAYSQASDEARAMEDLFYVFIIYPSSPRRLPVLDWE